jgi:ParB family transcriptional regulator, chromosome partitioning protein
MARKNLLAGLTGAKLTAVNTEAAPATPRPAPSFAGRGAVGAVTRSIEDLAAKAQAARELEARLTSGQVIVDLAPDTVDASFVADRMAQNDEEYQALLQSIAQSGQDSPILVRPHPDQAGRYQVAFGHRRLRAARELGKPVRAVIRPLSDRELVLAQGQENSARANLSFIERARFAHRLEQGGYDRETIMLALSADKTTVSRLITVVDRIPARWIDTIGPAPATGRDRWVELAALFHGLGDAEALVPLAESPSFQSADSDARFQLVHALLIREAERGRAGAGTPPPAKPGREPAARNWTHSSGTKVLTLAQSPRHLVLTIDKRRAPGFDTFLMERMEELYSDFLQSKAGK